MPNDITKTSAFEDRILDKIKAEADLFTPEELKEIVSRGLEKIFFTERKVDPNAHSWGVQYKESLAEELALETTTRLLEKEIEKHISEWVSSNPEKIEDLVRNTIQDGIGNCLIQAVSNMFSNEMWDLQSNIMNKLNPNI